MEIQGHRFENCGSYSPKHHPTHGSHTTPWSSVVLQLVDKDTKNTLAQSHSRIRSSFFRKPRDMSLEISEPIIHAVDVVLLTFILVWRERQSERVKNFDASCAQDTPPLSPLPVEYYISKTYRRQSGYRRLSSRTIPDAKIIGGES